MEVWRVVDDLVCTRRVPGQKGEISVATDPVGAPPGKWVFTAAGTAARMAMPDGTVATDLTICGIIDGWEEG